MALNLHAKAPLIAVPRTGGGDHWSASQDKTWTMCQRKWWMEKVARVKDNRPRTFLAVGKALHGVSERYHAQTVTSWDGLFPKGWDAGILPEQAAFIRNGAKQAVELGVWAATPGVKIEEPVMYLVGPDFRDHRGLPMVARPVTIMGADGERKHVEPSYLFDGTPLSTVPGWNRLPRMIGFIDVLKVAQAKVEDHKSAKNRRYALTPEKLKRDGQLLSYAALVFHLRPDVAEVTLQHNVFLKDPEAKEPTYAVKATVTLPEVVAHWDTIIAHVEESQALRQRVPAVAEDPLRRADRFLEVPGAADQGEARVREACDAYSGCPYKDMCMMRCTAPQIVARMDAPTISTLIPKAAPVPTLMQRLAAQSTAAPIMRPFTTPTTTPDATMPFPPKLIPPKPTAPGVGSDVYLLDPEDAKVQFRARIMGTDGETSHMALFPHVDVLPDFSKLSDLYRIDVPIRTILPVADLTAKITSYQSAYIAAGYTPHQTQWTTATGELIDDAVKMARINGVPQPIVAPPQPASAGAAQVAQMSRSKEAEAAANESVPAATFVPVEGQYLTVAPTTHPFWSQHVGKIARVTDVSPGDGGTHVLNVDIEGFDYTGVTAGRFVPVISTVPGMPAGRDMMVQPGQSLASAAHQPVPGDVDFGKGTITDGKGVTHSMEELARNTPLVGDNKGMVPPKDPIYIQPSTVSEIRPSTCAPPAMPTLIAAAKLMVAKLVEVRTVKGGPIIALLEDAHTEGITMIGGQVKLAWDQIERIALRDPAAIPPGGKPPKLTKEQKAAAKEAEAAEAKAKAAQAAEDLRITNRPKALDCAIMTLNEFLAGTKVSRKMLETLQPYLAEAKLHQDALEHPQEE